MWQQVEGFPRPAARTLARARTYLLMASGWRYGPCSEYVQRTRTHPGQVGGYKGNRRPLGTSTRLHHPTGVVASKRAPSLVMQRLRSRKHVTRTPDGHEVLTAEGLREAAMIAMAWRSTYGADLQLPVVPEWPDHPSRPTMPWERAWKMGFTARHESECPYPDDPRSSSRRTYRRHWMNGFKVAQQRSTVG